MAAQLQHAVGGIHTAGHSLIRLRVRPEQHPLCCGGVVVGCQHVRQQLVTAQLAVEADPVRFTDSGIWRVHHLGEKRAQRVGQADRLNDAVGLIGCKFIDISVDAVGRVDDRLGQVGAAAHRVFWWR